MRNPAPLRTTKELTAEDTRQRRYLPCLHAGRITYGCRQQAENRIQAGFVLRPLQDKDNDLLPDTGPLRGSRAEATGGTLETLRIVEDAV